MMQRVLRTVDPEVREHIAEVFGSPHDSMAEVEARAERLLPGYKAIVWEGDAATFQFGYVGRAAEDLLGYPTARWTTEPTFWADVVVHPEDRDDAVSYCALCTGKGLDHDFDYRARSADGRDVRLHDIVRVVKGDKGIAVKLRGVMLELSDSPQAALGRS